jgi:hypothetical protein
MGEESNTNPVPMKAAEEAPVSGEVKCALTGKVLKAEEAYWAPPLITAQELVQAVATTTLQAPGNLGQVLFGEQATVPYDPEMRDELAARRTTEQIKLLLVLVVFFGLLAGLIYLLTSLLGK